MPRSRSVRLGDRPDRSWTDLRQSARRPAWPEADSPGGSDGISGVDRKYKGEFMKHAYPPLVLMIITALSLTACGSQEEPQARSTQAVELSWADGVSSKEELIQKADAVVVGTVQSTDLAEATSFGALTDATIAVETWVKSLDAEPEEITIRQTGGVADGVLYEVEDDPLLTVGEKGVFFVRYDANTGVYVILGGPTGRFQVTGDDANPLPKSSIRGSKPEKLSDLLIEARESGDAGT